MSYFLCYVVNFVGDVLVCEVDVRVLRIELVLEFVYVLL